MTNQHYTDEHGNYYEELTTLVNASANHAVTFYGIDYEYLNTIFVHTVVTDLETRHRTYHSLENYLNNHPETNTKTLEENLESFLQSCVDARKDYSLDELPTLQTPREITFIGSIWQPRLNVSLQVAEYFNKHSIISATAYKWIDFNNLESSDLEALNDVLGTKLSTVSKELKMLETPLQTQLQQNESKSVFQRLDDKALKASVEQHYESIIQHPSHSQQIMRAHEHARSQTATMKNTPKPAPVITPRNDINLGKTIKL